MRYWILYPKLFGKQRQIVQGMTLGALRERILHGAYSEGEPLQQDAGRAGDLLRSHIA